MGFLSKLIGEFKSDGHSDPAHSADLGAVEEALKELPLDEARFLAAFALLLGRVAYADHAISKGEIEKMRNALLKEAKFDEERADWVVRLAVERILGDNFEEHIVTRRLKELTSRTQRRDVLRALFYVASDDDVTEQENEEIRRIAGALGFSDDEFALIRSEFRSHLAILKR